MCVCVCVGGGGIAASTRFHSCMPLYASATLLSSKTILSKNHTPTLTPTHTEKHLDVLHTHTHTLSSYYLRSKLPLNTDIADGTNENFNQIRSCELDSQSSISFHSTAVEVGVQRMCGVVQDSCKFTSDLCKINLFNALTINTNNLSHFLDYFI